VAQLDRHNAARTDVTRSGSFRPKGRGRFAFRRLASSASISFILVAIATLGAGATWAGVASSGALSRPSDASRYGRSVAVDPSGDTIIVGAPGIGDGNATGNAYVYTRSGGTFFLAATLRAAAATPKDGFGVSVAIRDDIIVVGAANAYGTPSSAYVFVRPAGGWSGTTTETARLTPSASTVYAQRFGVAVASGTGFVVVGDEQQAYVFVEPGAGWSGTHTETATLAGTYGVVGGTLAVDGDVVISGQRDASTAHAVHVYRKPAAGWAGTVAAAARLELPIGSSLSAIDMDGGVIVGGAPRVPVGGQIGRGAAYIYREPAAGWSGTVSAVAELIAGDGNEFDAFGSAVSIAGDEVWVGNTSGAIDGSQNDGVYQFIKPAGGWAGTLTQDLVIHRTGGSAGQTFGSAVDTNAGTTVVGDQFATAGNFSGAAYTYLRDDDDDDVADVVDNCPTVANADQADLDTDGLGDACDPDVDGDAVDNGVDNCPTVGNPSQLDLDADGLGDRCDTSNVVRIDIMPGVSPNAIRTAGRYVSVAILSSLSFDAATRVDPATLVFGKTGTEAAVVGACRVEDVDADGLDDLICDFEVKATGLTPKDVGATLSGWTSGVEATSFSGTDAVAMLKPR